LIIVLIFRDSAKAQSYIGLFAFAFGKRVDAFKMEGFGHAYLHTDWIAATQVALGSRANGFIQLHVPERAGRDAHAASKADRFLDDNSGRIRIALQSTDRAHVHTDGGLTLQTGAGENPPPVHVDIDKYIGAPASVSFHLMKLTGALAAETADTSIDFHNHNIHLKHSSLRHLTLAYSENPRFAILYIVAWQTAMALPVKNRRVADKVQYPHPFRRHRLIV
jgi:hypothetical protein